nr:unnamed protein product [Digitaria exilis]
MSWRPLQNHHPRNSPKDKVVAWKEEEHEPDVEMVDLEHWHTLEENAEVDMLRSTVLVDIHRPAERAEEVHIVVDKRRKNRSCMSQTPYDFD